MPRPDPTTPTKGIKMKNTKHTPGPWYIKGMTIRGAQISEVNGIHFVSVGGTYIPPNGEEVEANARLIAAAPVLFDSAKLMLEFLDNGTPVHPGSLLHGDLKNIVTKIERRPA